MSDTVRITVDLTDEEMDLLNEALRLLDDAHTGSEWEGMRERLEAFESLLGKLEEGQEVGP